MRKQGTKSFACDFFIISGLSDIQMTILGAAALSVCVGFLTGGSTSDAFLDFYNGAFVQSTFRLWKIITFFYCIFIDNVTSDVCNSYYFLFLIL